jgi:localization factor PodJL
MRSGGSLNVKVRPDAIETAREAARRSGLSLHQWINSAIIGTAAESGVRPRGAHGDPHNAPRHSGLDAVNERLDELAKRLDRMGPRVVDEPAAAPPPAAEPPSNVVPSLRALETRLASIARELDPQHQGTSQRLADAVTRLNQRLDHLIVERPASPDHDRRVAAVDRALAALNREPEKPVAASDWASRLDSAIAEISARQRELDGDAPPADGAAPAAPTPGTDLSALEQQLRTITHQLETMRGPCPVGDQVSALRQELTEIGRTLSDALPRRILEGLQAELRALPDRLDVGHEASPETPELTNVERGLAEIRDALNALAPAESVAGFDEEVKALSRKIDLLAGSGLDPEIVGQLEQAIAELRSIAGRVASGEALGALAGDVRALGGKLDRLMESGSGGLRGIEALSQRIDGLAASLEERAGQAADHGIPANFETLIHTLADKLEATRPSAPDNAAFDQLQGQIVRLAQKLDASDGRFGNLGAIERNISDMMAQLRDARATAIEAAQHAARAAAHELIDQSGPAGDVDALKREIVDLRATQAAIDRRTQDTLEAVHSTLERMVDRLAMIETDLAANARRPGEPASRQGADQRLVAEPPLREPVAAPAVPAARQSPAAPSRGGTQVMASTKPRVEFDDDQPLEPGSGSPRGRAASPAERIAASEAVLGAGRPQSSADPGGKANFIAAARRAAQAAAADPSASADRAGEDKPYGSALTAIGETLAKRRRPLLLGIGAFLLVLGGLHIITNMLHSRGGEAPRPAANDTVAPSRDSAPPATPPGQRRGSADPDTGAVQPATPGQPLNIVPETRSQLPPPVDAPATKPAAEAKPAAKPVAEAKPAAPGTLSVPLTIPQVTDLTGSVSRNAAPPPAAPLPGTAAVIPPPLDKIPVAVGGPALRTAAASGNPAAAYEIGLRYAEGRGIAQSFEEAVRWLDIAAKGGLAPAQYRLGSLHEKGHGTKKDREAARRLYVAAAEKGNAKAMHNLAVLYAEGLESKPDYQMASQWFRKAADHGISDSQYNLGILYARGIGVEQNLAESYKWFALAAAQGDADATKKRDDVAARLDAQSLVAAKLAVQTFTPDPQPDEAVTVKTPPGGWDQAATPPPAKPKASGPGKHKLSAI